MDLTANNFTHPDQFVRRHIGPNANEMREMLALVGVNEFVTDEKLTIPLLQIDEAATARQMATLARLRQTRDNALVQARLDALRSAARGTENLVPFILDCARAYATLYEIRAAMEDVFGAYREPVFF